MVLYLLGGSEGCHVEHAYAPRADRVRITAGKSARSQNSFRWHLAADEDAETDACLVLSCLAKRRQSCVACPQEVEVERDVCRRGVYAIELYSSSTVLLSVYGRMQVRKVELGGRTG